MSKEAMKQALEALELLAKWEHPASNITTKTGGRIYPHRVASDAAAALRQAIDQAEQDHTYGYAKGLAEAIFKRHFASDEHYASGRIVWGVNDTVIGILTQIDNMVAGMVRKPQQAEQAQSWTDDDMPKQYVMVGRFMLQPHPENGYWLTDTGTCEAMQIFQPEMERVIKDLWKQF